ncbi:DUF4157 domain-containing protein [Chitinophaga polysaccharea]|uniref:DUF4157 domain-containing protein n=1 Tax=Chitinophaga TaxID=79328 RepID=UPI001455A8A5|nr:MULTISPECIES: DUF4157 domain-containing protein [Chitinophaga]NLR61679.1 DUF4157 domain-containing protein [Chitinophaga polysaccharea]NLU93726.1 DUF4157 domain-containing protein [Chitinophaga sp. Ak27]
MEKIICRIRENSRLAKIAARFMRVQSVAMVLGRTIHLHGASRERFLSDVAWMRHEACHIKQYQRFGFFGFLWRYFAEYLRRGYYNNILEVAARAAEEDPAILDNIEII